MATGMYKTELGAKRRASKNDRDIVVRFRDGSYDWFPHGSGVTERDYNGNFVNVAQYNTHRDRWEDIPDEDDEGGLGLSEKTESK